jgi:Arsenical resistance operon trans-acting repressor ArsD.
MKIQVFDPPMCCSTGVCGPSVDPELVRFAADLDWLKRQGVEVERYNLTQQPAAFAGNKVVKAALKKDGNDCLPLTLADGTVVCEGRYPTREMLAGFAGLGVERSQLTNAGAKPDAGCCGNTAPTVKKSKKRGSCC